VNIQRFRGKTVSWKIGLDPVLRLSVPAKCRFLPQKKQKKLTPNFYSLRLTKRTEKQLTNEGVKHEQITISTFFLYACLAAAGGV
ncbi:MAG: hypothetical protein OEX00_02070, partial [Gammaproteobacteria bacterium]|nr:hypothetical protein [Gammaproteobacteria bacterium]